MRRITETERLIIDELQPGRDADFLQALLNQASFIENIRDVGVRTLEDADEYVARGPAKSYADHGFGLWRVSRRDNGAPVGMCGLIQREDLDYPDLGFAMLDDQQRQGFCREAAIATLDHAWRALGASRVLAIVAARNNASRALLASLGFADLGRIHATTGGMLLVVDRPSPAEIGMAHR